MTKARVITLSDIVQYGINEPVSNVIQASEILADMAATRGVAGAENGGPPVKQRRQRKQRQALGRRLEDVTTETAGERE